MPKTAIESGKKQFCALPVDLLAGRCFSPLLPIMPYFCGMIIIDDKLVSDELLEKRFVCDLHACKGACCVEGDSGAPLEEDELEVLEKIYKKVKPYLRKEGIKAIEEQGTWVKDEDDDCVTPLVNGAECAYVVFDENGITKCGIEQAWLDGKVKFRKPISCQLYPIRISQTRSGDVLNYHEWPICKPACSCGEKLDVKVYRFLKDAIIRKYGEAFYLQLEEADKLLESSRKPVRKARKS